MKTSRWALILVWTLIAGGFSVPASLAQESKGVGIVTTLTGQATVARPTQPQALPLHFKDDVYGRDRISTAEKSLVRVLLGGKAVVTVRELSVLTITEDMGHADINLQSGKVALAVAHQRMKPGESITLRARNAVAAIRGTVVIAEVQTATAQMGQPAQASAGIGVFHVLNGTVEVTPPGGNPFIVASGQSGDGTGRVWTRTPTEDAVIRQGLTTDQRGGPPGSVVEKEQAKAAALTELIAPGREQTDITIPTATICPPTCQVTVPNQPLPPNTANLIQNPGAEDVLANWNPTGATSSDPTFGFISSPEGRRMFVISTGAGSVNGTTSTLSQAFSSTDGSVFVLGFRSAFVSNEFPTQNPFFNDTFQATAIDAAGNQALLAMESRNTSAFNIAKQPFSDLGFTANPDGYGVTDFRTWARTWVTTTGDSGMLQFQVFNVGGDTAFDSAALIDSVFAFRVNPVFLVRNGAQMATTGPGALAEWITQPPVSFDSLMVVCCQGVAFLGGQLLHAKNTDLDVPFSLLSAIQGGRVFSSTQDSLVLLEGGNHTIGTQVGIFDLSGVNTTVDPATGIVLGSDQVLSFRNALFETSGAQVTTRKIVQLDTGIIEASAPLIWAHNGSNVTTSQDAIDLSFRARVVGLGPVVKLDGSTLTVANGSAVNVAASSLRISGDLITLLNGSILNVLNGALLSASGGANVFVSGALVAFGGTGGNVVSVANNFCPCTSIAGIPVSLAGGATAAQVSIGAGAIKNASLGTVTQNVALIRVVGPTAQVRIGGSL
ncbi:MAG TPA: FecR domain-containing protein [Methylomirabilota bacterium]|nr:FecR domain-containing protein [Methylomirabilota bacterium]